MLARSQAAADAVDAGSVDYAQVVVAKAFRRLAELRRRDGDVNLEDPQLGVEEMQVAVHRWLLARLALPRLERSDGLVP